MMKLGGNGDADTIHTVEEIAVVCGCPRAAFGRDLCGAGGVCIDHPDQGDIRLSGVFLGVETPQVANSHYARA
jgi:hypothetical protein